MRILGTSAKSRNFANCQFGDLPSSKSCPRQDIPRPSRLVRSVPFRTTVRRCNTANSNLEKSKSNDEVGASSEESMETPLNSIDTELNREPRIAEQLEDEGVEQGPIEGAEVPAELRETAGQAEGTNNEDPTDDA